MSAPPFRSSYGHAALLSVPQMYQADAWAIEHGTPSLELMEAAGMAVAQEAILALKAEPKHTLIVVLCGTGNNGGDGFVAARVLHQQGYTVRLALAGDVAGLKGDALINAQRWQACGGGVSALAPDLLEGAGLVIDALFGAGLNRPLEGNALACVRVINERSLKCLAVDVPSGVDGNTGAILGDCPRCFATITFFRPKVGHALYPAKAFCGHIRVADIGIKADAVVTLGVKVFLNGTALWSLPQPHWSDHKYSRGHVLVFGGHAMSGAARLALRAARRVGAGLATACVPSEAFPLYAADAPGVLLMPWDTDSDIRSVLSGPRKNSYVIGPGLPANEATRRVVLEALTAESRTIVLDAGALTAFTGRLEELTTAIIKYNGTVVLTPHDGEYQRLFGSESGDRLHRAHFAAQQTGAVVLLKGADTVVASPDGYAGITVQAPPYLATAGSGDVLAGLIAGLAAQGMDGFTAALAGAWLHAEAGRAAGPGLIAEDLPECLPMILRRLHMTTSL